jgi:hypothetical protein
MFTRAARDHRSHPVSESGKTNHHDVNQKKEQKEHGHEKMNRARGLLAAERSNSGWKHGSDGGGHRQACPDY